MRYVPTDEFAPVLRRLVADYGDLSGVAEQAGVNRETLEQILRQRRVGCDFNTADRLLCALGNQHLWWGELRHIYYAIVFEQECDRPGCDVVFEPAGHQMKRFCSDTCRAIVAKGRKEAAMEELRVVRESYKEARAA